MFSVRRPVLSLSKGAQSKVRGVAHAKPGHSKRTEESGHQNVDNKIFSHLSCPVARDSIDARLQTQDDSRRFRVAGIYTEFF